MNFGKKSRAETGFMEKLICLEQVIAVGAGMVVLFGFTEWFFKKIEDSLLFKFERSSSHAPIDPGLFFDKSGKNFKVSVESTSYKYADSIALAGDDIDKKVAEDDDVTLRVQNDPGEDRYDRFKKVLVDKEKEITECLRIQGIEVNSGYREGHGVIQLDGANWCYKQDFTGENNSNKSFLDVDMALVFESGDADRFVPDANWGLKIDSFAMPVELLPKVAGESTCDRAMRHMDLLRKNASWMREFIEELRLYFNISLDNNCSRSYLTDIESGCKVGQVWYDERERVMFNGEEITVGSPPVRAARLVREKSQEVIKEKEVLDEQMRKLQAELTRLGLMWSDKKLDDSQEAKETQHPENDKQVCGYRSVIYPIKLKNGDKGLINAHGLNYFEFENEATGHYVATDSSFGSMQELVSHLEAYFDVRIKL